MSFQGTWALIKLYLRNDWVKTGAWLVGLSLLMAGFIAAIEGFLTSEQELLVATALFAQNPALRVFALPLEVSMGGFLMLRTFTFFAILVALMNTMAITRMTRASEESGQAELIGAGAVGRHAPLSAALIIALAMNAVLLAVVFLLLVSNDYSVAGSIAAAVSIGGVGVAFAGIAAVCAQLTRTSRGANGLAGMSIGVAFLLSSLGSVMGKLNPDGLTVQNAWYSWISPIGWGQLVAPFAGENWWVAGLFVVLFITMAITAFVIASRRDLGQGVFPGRRGPASAVHNLRTPFGLVWRLQRGVLLWWVIVVVVFSTVFGTITDQVSTIMDQIEHFEQMMLLVGGVEDITTAFIFAIMGIFGAVVTIFALQSILRARAEESVGTAEAVLSTAVGRVKWLGSYIISAILGVGVILLMAGLAAGIAAGLATGDLQQHLSDFIAAALVQIPAILLLMGLAVAVSGWLPRLAIAITWLAFAAAVTLGPIIGSLLDLPDWVQDISPFTHTPAVPGDEVSAVALAVFALITLALITFGLVGFSKRDLATE